MCSGSGGPLVQIQQDMKKSEQFDVKVTLTDLYPPSAEVNLRIKHSHLTLSGCYY